ncbi:hypothetical protein [Alcaligenes sp. SDU_A2]|uniref:hypothetical protein n=1 Tax=Alcaligenes sp. SDU_A2 TaxID=3136634 RepID=UPI002C8B3921|nr:hypothetical protein [Alcaligenes sp.]HRL25938.1 hypothetical protein [Alcaligenes sp.]
MAAIGVRVWAGGLARKAVATIMLATLVACATQGNSFQASGLNQMVPGQTSRAQAEVFLQAPPHQVYRQLDGSELAVWLHGATLATDAVYFRQELWLRFDAAGRFQQVVKRSNIPPTYREQAPTRSTGSITIESPDSDMITILPVSQ